LNLEYKGDSGLTSVGCIELSSPPVMGVPGGGFKPRSAQQPLAKHFDPHGRM